MKSHITFLFKYLNFYAKSERYSVLIFVVNLFLPWFFKSFEYTQALSVCNGWRHTTISQSKKVFSWLFLFFFSQVVISFSLQNLNHYCLRESFLEIVLNAIHPQTTAGVLAAWRRFNTFEVRPSDIPKLCTRDAKRSIIAFIKSLTSHSC